jgi:hypothetical protein
MRSSALLRSIAAAYLLNTCASGLSHAQTSPVAGEYLCEECHGFLRIQPDAGSRVKVWLGVGGGSCGGEVLVKATAPVSGASVRVPRTEKKRTCVTTIRFEGGRAEVSDSCISPESEESSTCAMMGTYLKR